MEVRVKQIDRFKFRIEARSHSLLCDQPPENGGEDSGMTPPELLLASLGSCAEFYAVQYLRTREIDDCGVEVTVTAEKLLQPARLGNFRIQVTCPTALTEGQAEVAPLGASLFDPQHVALYADSGDRIRTGPTGSLLTAKAARSLRERKRLPGGWNRRAFVFSYFD